MDQYGPFWDILATSRGKQKISIFFAPPFFWLICCFKRIIRQLQFRKLKKYWVSVLNLSVEKPCRAPYRSMALNSFFADLPDLISTLSIPFLSKWGFYLDAILHYCRWVWFLIIHRWCYSTPKRYADTRLRLAHLLQLLTWAYLGQESNVFFF